MMKGSVDRRPLMAPRVAVVGGGLIGLTTAFFLHERGAEVTIVDAGALGSGAARGNAGFLCTTLVAPLPAPGVVRSALRSLLDPAGALRVRPAALPALSGWMLGFAKASRSSRFATGRAALARLNASTPSLVARLAAAGVAFDDRPGIVVPFHDASLAERFLAGLAPIADLTGTPLPDALVGIDELRRVVPMLTDHVRAGFVLPGERSIDPRRYVDTMISLLQSRNVQLREHAPIERVDERNDRVTAVRTDAGRIEVDHLVVCAGAGSRAVGRLLDLRIPVIAGQGYNVALPAVDGLLNAVIFEEAHAVATPFADRVRLGGTMELAADAPPFDGRRVDAIVRSLQRFLDLDWSARFDAWSGSRPMSADGLPLIGAPRRWTNVTLATGHGMWGLTLAPSTGAAVAELVIEGRASVDLSPFDPNRFRL